MANDMIPIFEDADHLTCLATAAITGKTFVDISGNRDSGPGLAPDGSTKNVYKVAPATAAGLALGVAEYDAANGTLVTVARTPGMVVPVTTGAAITAGAEVEVGAGALAVPHAAGIAVGRCLTGAASGADAEIILYK